MGFKLGGDDMFRYFGQKGEIGEGPLVARGVRVESRFFDGTAVCKHNRDSSRWGYSSVVEHLTADQEVSSSSLDAP